MLRPSAPPARPAAPEAGFSLLEAAIGLSLLAVAILAHASTTVSEHRLGREEQVRSEGLHVATQFLERLRSDEDWDGLYPRLRTLQEQADTPGSGATRLDDGREAYLPTSYFPEFAPSDAMPVAYFLVEVPSAPAEGAAVGDPWVLREDVNEPQFGLPSDLNGDGAVDSASRDADHAVLPVRVIVRWTPVNEVPREMTISTWLRGNR